MKKIKIIFVCFIFIQCFVSNNVYAQWYRSYGVTNINELTENQLDIAFSKAEKTISSGKTLTFVGGLATVIGGIIYVNYLNKITTGSINNLSSNVNKSLSGSLIMSGGGLLLTIGIPVWISGYMRKSDVEIARGKYSTKIQVKPYLNYDQKYGSLGLRFAISF